MLEVIRRPSKKGTEKATNNLPIKKLPPTGDIFQQTCYAAVIS
jgi:hypothetical protein